jgi:acetylornithine deacetylase/succinyl-diaminopimelate desuccinylase-like protein
VRPSDAVEPVAWERAHAELVDHLRALIRIPSVNPPPVRGDDERVSLDALRFGLPVLYDVVRRFCG